MPIRWILVAALVAACGDSKEATKPQSAPTPEAPAPAVKPVPVPILADPTRWDCKADADCINSCQHGAVNGAWYQRAETSAGFEECSDGCNNQISAPPRCDSGACVAYQSNPQNSKDVTRREHCTRVGG